jgi:hypothetical protein
LLARPREPSFDSAQESNEMLLTDLCNRRWTRAPAESLAARAGGSRHREPKNAVPKPEHHPLGAGHAFQRDRPRSEVRFDDAPPASAVVEDRLRPARERSWMPLRAAPPRCSVFGCTESSSTRPLTSPVAVRALRRVAAAHRQDSPSRILVNGCAANGPRRLPPTSARRRHRRRTNPPP